MTAVESPSPSARTDASAVLPYASPATPDALRPPPWLNTTFLDGLRGLAALYVFIRHASVYLYARPDHPGWVDRFMAAGLGSFRYAVAAVYFFFVLSGFVIHLRYAQKLALDPARATFGWPGFFWRRARRLYPPLLFALALTFAFDAAGMRLHFPIYHDEAGLKHLVFHPDHSLATLLANVAFLANVKLGPLAARPVWGTDAPLWSLTFEWWFYMIYPAFWWLSKRSILLATAVVAAGYGMHFLTRDYPAVHLLQMTLTAFPAWWLGALLADVYAGRIKVSFAALSPLALLVPFIARFFSPTRLEERRDHSLEVIVLALAFAGLIALCFTLQQRGWRLRPLRALKPLGDMSYTLYLIHMPICVFLSGWIMSRSADRHLPGKPWLFALTLLGVLPLAWLIHLLVERPFTRTSRGKKIAPPAA